MAKSSKASATKSAKAKSASGKSAKATKAKPVKASASVKKAAPKSVKKTAAKKGLSPSVRVCTADEMSLGMTSISRHIQREFPEAESIVLLGIRTRGVVLAERLKAMLEKGYGKKVATGILDITLYRDDLSSLGPQPMVRDSEIPFDVTGTNVIIVDDVIYTGRTIRAAMDEIIDFGRPRRIRLAVLVDRGCREYPIQPDYIGKKIPTTDQQSVRVCLSEIDDSDEIVLDG